MTGESQPEDAAEAAALAAVIALIEQVKAPAMQHRRNALPSPRHWQQSQVNNLNQRMMSTGREMA